MCLRGCLFTFYLVTSQLGARFSSIHFFDASKVALCSWGGGLWLRYLLFIAFCLLFCSVVRLFFFIFLPFIFLVSSFSFLSGTNLARLIFFPYVSILLGFVYFRVFSLFLFGLCLLCLVGFPCSLFVVFIRLFLFLFSRLCFRCCLVGRCLRCLGTVFALFAVVFRPLLSDCLVLASRSSFLSVSMVLYIPLSRTAVGCP